MIKNKKKLDWVSLFQKREKETKRKIKPRWSILGIFLLILLLTAAEIFFQKQDVETPISSNIAVLFLLNINVILLLLLVLLVARNLVRLYIERRSKVIGSKFQTKLVVSYLVLTLVPSVLLFLVASGLLTNSIDKWFNVQVEESLRQSLEVAESFYKGTEENVLVHANILSQLFSGRKMLAEKNRQFLKNIVKRKHSEYGVDSIVVYGTDGIEIAGAVDPTLEEFFKNEEVGSMIMNAIKGTQSSRIIPYNNQNLVIAVAPVRDFWNREVIGATLASELIARDMVAKINNIASAFEEYLQLRVLQFPIKVSYEITLLLITLVILFAAIWYGFYLAKSISVPIQELVEATRTIAGGNLDYQINVKANDEIKMLVDAFNKMISEMKKNREAINKGNENLLEKNKELDRHGKYIETILENVAAGVISIDRLGRVSTINSSASLILGLDADSAKGNPYRKVFDVAYLDSVRGIIRELREKSSQNIEKQTQVTVGGRSKTLLINICVLRNPEAGYQGMVIVFDDLSELIKAQKVAAWKEVAQGIAHEIKNPLTPILLNTQRLQKKYKDGAPDFDEVFLNATDVIIKEVEGVKKLLDEFSKFARMPEPNPKAERIHDIIKEVVNLYRDNRKQVFLREHYDDRVGLVNVDREQIKRVFINLIENALDASCDGDGVINIETFFDENSRIVRIILADNGTGVSQKFREKLFMPYFSTKKKGTGLGLAIVNRIIVDHNGLIRVEDNQPKGTRFLLELPA